MSPAATAATAATAAGDRSPVAVPPLPPATPPSTGPATGPASVPLTGTPVDVDRWLVVRRNEGATPDELVAQLVAHGWDADVAARTALGSLRRVDRRPLLWFTLCWAAGLSAVGLTTALHQLLAEYPDRSLAAFALTVAVVMAPIAVGAGLLARRAEADSPFTVWSPQRRGWFATLATCTAVVGLVRLVAYVYAVISSVVASPPEPLYGRDLAQVAVSLAVALPMFWWSFSEWRRSDLAISGLREDHHPASRP